jgi:hypothetical protein
MPLKYCCTLAFLKYDQTMASQTMLKPTPRKYCEVANPSEEGANAYSAEYADQITIDSVSTIKPSLYDQTFLASRPYTVKN